MQALTHFRCVFDVSSAESLPNAWPALIGEIRAWVSRKEGTPIKNWFFNGGSWSSAGPRKARIEVKTISDGGPTPAMWTLRYEHLDSSVAARRWITNVGVAQAGDREWRIAVEVLHGLRPDYVGNEPETPRASSPNLVSALLNSNRWVSRVGVQRLRGTLTRLKVGDGHELCALLQNPLRLVPIVLVSCDRKIRKPKLDAGQLSRELAGTAVVYLCESPECDDELQHLIPYAFRSGNGTVRIYAPGADFTQAWTATRHRFLAPKTIDELGQEVAGANIVRALTRSDAWRGLQSTVRGIEDIDARIRERRLAELRSAHSSSMKEKDEFLELFAAENADLEKRIRALTEELEAARDEANDTEEKLGRREYEFEQARVLADQARTALQTQQQALQAVLALPSWPRSAEEVAKLAGRAFSDRLVLTEQAARSLVASKFASLNDSADVLWRILRAMAIELHPLLLEQEASAQNAADVFRQRTGFELTWTETKPTKRDNKLMALRRMVYGGQEVDITPHLKWGNKAPKCLRVHFWVDRDQRQLVVGHCGDHLDTYGTQRRR